MRNLSGNSIKRTEERIRTEDGLLGELWLHSGLLSSSEHSPNWDLAKLRIVGRGSVLNVSRQLQLSKSLCSLDRISPRQNKRAGHFTYYRGQSDENQLQYDCYFSFMKYYCWQVDSHRSQWTGLTIWAGAWVLSWARSLSSSLSLSSLSWSSLSGGAGGVSWAQEPLQTDAGLSARSVAASFVLQLKQWNINRINIETLLNYRKQSSVISVYTLYF